MSETEPKLIRRACGGWLAISPPEALIRIGVTADTEADAREKFKTTITEWFDLIALPWSPIKSWPARTFDNMPPPKRRYGRRRHTYRRTDVPHA